MVRRLAAVLVVLAAAALGLVLTRGLQRSGADGAPAASGAAARVLLFAPNLTETAWALGRGTQVVGVTDFCVWPEEAAALPRVGGMVDPNLERILALDPDLLVVQGESRPLADLARHADLRLARVDMDRDLASVLEGFVRLDSLLSGGSTERGRALRARVRGELDAVAAAAPARRPRVLLSLGHDPGALTRLWTAGGGSFLHELLEHAGGNGLFAERDRSYFELSLETLLADPPEVVLELRPGEELDGEARRALARVWRDAGLGAAVAVVTFDGLLIPGPRVGESAAALQRALRTAGEAGP